MKTIKDLKNYVKYHTRIVVKDLVDINYASGTELMLINDMKIKKNKLSKRIYKEYRTLLNNDSLPLISGNYGSTGRLKISENKINYVSGQDARLELHYCLEDYLRKHTINLLEKDFFKVTK